MSESGRASVARAIRAALLTGSARAKVFAARKVARDWRLGRLAPVFDVAMPDRPAWPASLELLPPSQMPKRGKMGSQRNRIALWHALAHIEFVAIDLALDMVGRFGATMPRGFIDDFLGVAADEAMHFALLERKLASLGTFYGALPAHAGLWESAHRTRHDVGARLAVVPMVLEARGLDVTPGMIDLFRRAGSDDAVAALETIYAEEVGHVAYGSKWFHFLCGHHDLDPDCVMYWSTENELLMDKIRERLELDQSEVQWFCAQCQADVAAAQTP